VKLFEAKAPMAEAAPKPWSSRRPGRLRPDMEPDPAGIADRVDGERLLQPR
jgi:hypothetical protein